MLRRFRWTSPEDVRDPAAFDLERGLIGSPQSLDHRESLRGAG